MKTDYKAIIRERVDGFQERAGQRSVPPLAPQEGRRVVNREFVEVNTVTRKREG